MSSIIKCVWCFTIWSQVLAPRSLGRKIQHKGNKGKDRVMGKHIVCSDQLSLFTSSEELGLQYANMNLKGGGQRENRERVNIDGKIHKISMTLSVLTCEFQKSHSLGDFI